jgi:F-type H+-transporting ATPase subunit epsilon
MAETFELEVATPDRLLVKDQVAEAQIPELNGFLGVLPEHAPLLSELGSGLLSYVIGGKSHSVVVSGGWVEVQPHGTRVLAKTAERPDEIDLKRAQESLDRAERRLKESGEWDIARALRAAERARVRVEAASKKAH